jgi:glycosyltransferase involved in cell wall biosynthesis
VFVVLTLAARCPLVLQLHGAGFERLRDGAGPLGRRVIRLLLEHAAYIVVPCESLRVWVGTFTRSARVVCVPNPVAAAESPQTGRRPNVVLFLSKLDAANGVTELMEAVARVRATVPDLRLVYAGNGDRAVLARHAERLGIADAVHFTGWVGPSGKRALLESAAVFALPAYDQALPTSLLEAMGAGVPVVVSAVGGAPEVVADGVTGFLVAPGDIVTLQRVLTRLLVDRTLAARIGAAARESIRLRFAPERAVPRLEAVYAAVGLSALDAEPAPLRDIRVKGAA